MTSLILGIFAYKHIVWDGSARDQVTHLFETPFPCCLGLSSADKQKQHHQCTHSMHTQPDLQPIEEKAVEVRAAAGKGLGLFAVADIQEVGDEKGAVGVVEGGTGVLG
jgi:hypothetical protein